MTRKTVISTIIIVSNVFFNILLSACAHQNGTAKPNPILADLYLKKGKAMKKKGYLTEAHEYYKLALVVDPTNDSAALLTKKLTRNFIIRADKHFKLGAKYNREKKFGLARKELLTALNYQQNHQKAYKMLMTERLAGFTSYIKPTVTKKAASPPVKRLKTKKKEPQQTKPVPPLPLKAKREDQALAYRANGIYHLKHNHFSSAIEQFEKYLQARPNDTEGLKLLSNAYFQKAQIHYNQGDFMAAKKGFESALEYDIKCEKCAAYINQSLENFKNNHYNKGVVYYTNQQLAQAVSEWEMVYELDPNYKDVEQKLHKARFLLKNLENIKKSRQS
jgi:tetratricopeptide (TPR) repeat protein